MDSSQDDDPVLKEIPVFLSQSLSKQLFVFQYPMKPTKESWDDSHVLNSKIKPVHRQVKLEFALDIGSDRYDSSKAEQIALNTDGDIASSRLANKEKEKNTYFKSGYMDKLFFESSIPVTDSSKYTIAVLQDGEMHVTPINGILQLRPSYSYYDKQDKRTKDEEAEKMEVDEEAGPSTEPEAKQVTVSFARTESDRIKKAREKSYGYLTKKSSEEPWCDTTWWHSTSDEADLERNKLFTSATSDDASRLNLTPEHYLTALVPPDPESLVATKSSNELINLCDLKKLSLSDQCKQILKDAKLVTIGWISALVGTSGAPLLTALASSGRLLRGGRWAARSSLIYPPGCVSQHSGVPDDLMCRARDYVLYLFTQSQYVDRRKVAAAVKLPSEEVKEILSSVSRYQKDKGWELFIAPDPDFETKYPDIQQRQTHFWDARQRQFNEMLSGEQITSKRQRKKSQRDSCSSDNGLSSPKLRNNMNNHSQPHRENSFSSDNENSSDSKKNNKKNTTIAGGTCSKRTKLPSGGINSFNISDNNRVS